MEKRSFILWLTLMVLAATVVVAEPVIGQTPGVAGRYNPGTTYPGVYEKNTIYKKRSDGSLWRGNARPSQLYRVTCAEAQQSLGTNGMWTGNLNRDGSCGPSSEPAQWAVGNFLNFTEASDQ